MDLQVKVPWWAEKEDDQNAILFLAFLYKLSTVYGFKHFYRLYNTDVRTILGITGIEPVNYLNQKYWYKYLNVANTGYNNAAYRLEKIRHNPNSKDTFVRVDLKDERCKMVYIYLMGCFNNNLVEPNNHYQAKGLDKLIRNALAGGDSI